MSDNDMATSPQEAQGGVGSTGAVVEEQETGSGAVAAVGEIVQNTAENEQQPIRIMSPNGRGYVTPIRTSEQGRAMAEKRWGAWRRAAEAGAVIGVLGADAPITLANKIQAYIEMTAVQAKAAMDVEHPQMSQAYRNVRQAIGADVGAPARTASEAMPESGVKMLMSDSAAAAIAVALAEASKRGQ